jgi:DNA adenine methylase
MLTEAKTRYYNIDLASKLFLIAKEYLSTEHYRENILTRGYYYFILNKTAYSGLEKSTFSKTASEHNFSFSCINKLSMMESFLKDVKLTNLSYEELFKENNMNIFYYLDPPYQLDRKNNDYYGLDGNLHREFDHNLFYENIKKIKK